MQVVRGRTVARISLASLRFSSVPLQSYTEETANQLARPDDV
jgi:hypothetical protein